MRKFLLFIFLFLLSVQIYCQQSNCPIELTLNFKSQSWEYNSDLLQTLSKGDFYRVSINNINQNVWRINIGNTDTTYVTKPLSYDLFSNIPLDPIQGILTNISSVSTKAQQVVEKFKLNDKMKSFNIDSEKNFDIFSESLQQDVLNFLQQEPNPEEELILVFASQRSILELRDNEFRLSKIVLEQKLAEAQLSLIHYSLIDNSSNEIPDFKDFKPSIFYAQLEEIRARNLSLQSIVVKEKINFNNNIQKVIEKKNNIFITRPALKKDYDNIILAFDKIISNGDKISEQASPLKQVMLIRQFIDKVNNKSTSYTSLPLMFTGNETTLHVKISPKDTISTLPIYQTKLVFPIQKNSYWGVSTGFYYTILNQDNYSLLGTEVPNLDNTTSQVQYELRDEDLTNHEIGFAAMIRRGWFIGKDKYKSTESFHVGFGPGIRLGDKLQPRLLLGTGVGFGREHKILLDVGGIFGPVDRKSNAFEVDTQYVNIEPSDVVVSKISGSAYISISYLFGF